MLCPAATAGPLPCLSTSVVSALGAGVFGTVSVGFSPKPPVTDTPTLVVAPLASVDDEEEDEPDDPQATRVAGVSRQAATRTAPARCDRWCARRWDSFTGQETFGVRGGTDTSTVTAQAGRSLHGGPARERGDNRRVRIDLNADVAESFGRWRLGDDAALLPYLTSANVACGFHAGDARTIWETVGRCAELGVVVGAQVSYRDLAGFGRRAMDVEPADLAADVLYQLAALDGLAR